MKKTIQAIAIIALGFYSSCSPKKAIINSTTSSVSVADQDGTTYERAVVIIEKTETKGVKAEYKWLSEKHPGYTFISQKLLTKSDKPYDLILIKTHKGEKTEVYFDISNFFGKF